MESVLLQGWKSLFGDPYGMEDSMDRDVREWPIRLQVSSSNIKGEDLMDSGVAFGV